MDFLSHYFNYDSNVISGLTSELNVFCVLDYFDKSSKNVIVLTNTLYEANKLYKLLITHYDNTLLYPMDELISFAADAVSPELKINRLETIDKIKDNNKSLIVTNLFGFLKKVPSSKSFDNSLNISVGQVIDRDDLIDKLILFGYNRDSLVTNTGEFAIRGYILDVFLFDYDHPIRIEFFDDSVESIRSYDETTQRSLYKIDSIVIKPVDELITDSMISFYDFCNKANVILFDINQLMVSNVKLLNDVSELVKSGKECLSNQVLSLNDFDLDSFLKINSIDKDSDTVVCFEIDNFNGSVELLKKFVSNYLAKYYDVTFCLSNKSQIKNVRELFGPSCTYLVKKLNHGFVIDKHVVISDNDIDKNVSNEIKYKNNFHLGRKIKDYDQLEIGDYVVHSIHGIGIYNGLITLERNGIKKDYLQINYLGNDKIYIAVENINNIYKYSSKDGLKPKINKLNSSSWIKTKNSVRSRIKDISDELIKLYAERASINKEPFKTYEEETIFASQFKYSETDDQLKAIEEIDLDLKSTKPMDRLLCGDVGFGKTEVAFRGMFKTVLNNKQVFYLCPTTILSKQQYESAKERFKEYPIEIALINRFTSNKELGIIKNGLASGKIDIVFGTHRLLNPDIKFKNLGMLIVDEEQRFGVTHKERIKEFKNDVNVLTLSATPIPRTLKMALSGLRDLTIIDTAPVNRYPVQTYVMAENDFILKEAVYKELSRNGQAFILFNNISEMESKRDHLTKLIPEARIVSVHGQMNKIDLENIMQDFIDYRYDVLLCTTIIETGIDIPNANTLIVFDADHFGLSQLYQLRGRVGRSDRIAFAYLFYSPSKLLNDIAVKRLNAIKEFTELGSGYKIAMRDLSIRGAGDLLGSEQAGFVDAVGLSLYMKMVDDEVKRKRGEYVCEEEQETPSLISVDTHISDDYVSEEDLKIEIHQKINEIDSYETLVSIKNELEDRFGKISQSMLIYMYEEWFDKLAKKLDIYKVMQSDRFVEVELPVWVSEKIKGDKLFMEAYSISPKFQLKYFNKRITITLPIKQVEKHFLIYFIPLLEKILRQVK